MMDDEYNDVEDNRFAEKEEYVPYVSAATLGQHTGRKIRCWGRVTGVASSGSDITIRTVDDADVSVHLRSPIGSRPSAWVEVIGVAQGRTIMAEEVVSFNDDACQDVDKEGHRALAHLLTALEDPWNLGETENGHA